MSCQLIDGCTRLLTGFRQVAETKARRALLLAERQAVFLCIHLVACTESHMLIALDVSCTSDCLVIFLSARRGAAWDTVMARCYKQGACNLHATARTSSGVAAFMPARQLMQFCASRQKTCSSSTASPSSPLQCLAWLRHRGHNVQILLGLTKAHGPQYPAGV